MSKHVFTFPAIGEVRSCFKEKFGIPRQPGLAPTAMAEILIYPEFARAEAFAGLDQCSHIWLQFVFHASEAQWRPKVRPPRLGGNKTLGVFASRAPNRPNPIGLSVVTYLGAEQNEEGYVIKVGGVDLLDGTPILDIKPYVPYVDAVADAINSIAPEAPRLYPVHFSETVLAFCSAYDAANGDPGGTLATLVKEVLRQDPRPQYQAVNESRVYGMRLFDLNVRWNYRLCEGEQAENLCIYVVSVAPIDDCERLT
jgi:tRNA-Thr(GGU) m(6)t(6)A37 methyltransferase TsaA